MRKGRAWLAWGQRLAPDQAFPLLPLNLLPEPESCPWACVRAVLCIGAFPGFQKIEVWAPSLQFKSTQSLNTSVPREGRWGGKEASSHGADARDSLKLGLSAPHGSITRGLLSKAASGDCSGRAEVRRPLSRWAGSCSPDCGLAGGHAVCKEQVLAGLPRSCFCTAVCA